MLDDSVSGLIGRIYDSVHDPVRWSSALDSLIERTNSQFVFLSSVDLKAQHFSDAHFQGNDSGSFLDGVRDYKDHFYRDDPTLHYAARNPSAGGISLSAVVADPETDPYARWYRDTLGSAECTVYYTPPDDGLSLGLSFHCKRGQGPHDANDLRLAHMLFEHVERAMRIAARPPDLASTEDARIFLDRRGRVRAASPAAEALLARCDGLSITDGQLTAGRKQDAARINAMIRSALGALQEGTAGGTARVARPSGLRPWILTASPLPNPASPFDSFRPAVQVRLVDPDAGASLDDAMRWSALFGFTRAEAQLLVALVEGEGSLREASELRAVSYGTARVQLASIFAKAGVRSQAQLMRLLARSNAP